MALLTRSEDQDHAPSYPPTPPDDGIDWVRLLSALKNRAAFILLVTIAGTALGIAAARMIRPTYMVEARVWIDASARGAGEIGPIQSRQLFETDAWEELLRSYRVLDDVVRDERLYLSLPPRTNRAPLRTFSIGPDVHPGDYVLRTDSTGTRFVLTTKGGVSVDRGIVGDSIGRSVGFVWAPDRQSLGAEEVLEFSVRRVRDAARGIATTLQSRMDPKGNFMRISLEGRDPVRAAATLNAIVDQFVSVAGDLKRATISERTRILAEQLASAQRQLDSADRALEAFRIRTITLPGPISGTADAAAGGGDTNPILNAYFNLLNDRDELRRSRQAIETALTGARTGPLPIETLQSIAAVRGSAEMQALLDELAKKRAALREARYRFTERSTSVQQLVQEITRLEKEALPAQARILDEELRRREEVLNGLITNQAARLERIPPRTLQEAKLTRDVTLSQQLYSTLQQRYDEARLAEVSSIPDVRVLDMAAPPEEPESQKAARLMLLAFVASLGAGLFGAVVLDRTDPRVRYPVQVTRGMGLNILGGIPRLKGGRGRRGRENRAQVLESFRSLRLSLDHAYGAAGPRVITISSPEQGDGKSFVSTNLAGVFARQGLRTIIVDGDMRRGKQHDLLACRRSPGLSDYLERKVPAEDIVQHASAAGLDLIPGGTPRLNSGELVTSRRLGQLLSFLKSEYDVILVDTPPLRAGVDALALSALTGNLLFVLRTGSTDRIMAESKLSLLDQLPVRVLGAVLNDIRHQEGAYRHYAYDSYYHVTEIDALRTSGAPRRLAAPEKQDRA